MGIERIKGTSDKYASYIKSKLPQSKLGEIGFSGNTNSGSITTTSTSLLSTNDDKICGILSFKNATLNKQEYLHITNFLADSSEIAKELLTTFIAIYLSSKKNFVLTDFVQIDSVCSKVLESSHFRKWDILYGDKRSSILNRLSRSNSIILERFRKSNRSTYSRAFSEILLDFDTSLAKFHNSSIGKNILQTDLKSDRAQRLRVSYFINGVLNNTNWYSFLAFDSDDEEKETPIGFVKGLFDSKDKAMFVEMFFSKNSANVAEKALYSFLNQIPPEYIFALTEKADKAHISSYGRWFGKELGASYFYS